MNITTLEQQIDRNAIHRRLRVEGEHGTLLVHHSVNPDLADTHDSYFLSQGIMQAPFDASAQTIHSKVLIKELAASVTTIGNNGIGFPNGRDSASREGTAHDRSELIKRLTGPAGGYAIGFSLGSQTVNDMLRHTIYSNQITGMPIKGVIHIGPGLVAPIRAREKTGRLLSNVIDTTGRHLLNHPFAIPTSLWEYSSVIQRSFLNRQPIDHQRSMVELGTEPEHIKEVGAYYPMDVTGGQNDAVFDTEMWQALESENISVYRPPAVGHELVFTPSLAIPAISSALERLRARQSRPAAA